MTSQEDAEYDPPSSLKQPLTDDEVVGIQRQFPWIPQEYLDWMASKGRGEHPSGYRFYSKPVDVADVFGELSQRWTGHAYIIAEKNWDLAIGYVYYPDREEHWELTFLDAGIIDMSPIPQGIEAFLIIECCTRLLDTKKPESGIFEG